MDDAYMQSEKKGKKKKNASLRSAAGGGGGLPIRENLSVNIPLWLSNFMSSQDH